MIVENLTTAQREVEDKFLALSECNNPCGNLNRKHNPKPMARGLVAIIREA
jgi:hypothetical protein